MTALRYQILASALHLHSSVLSGIKVPLVHNGCLKDAANADAPWASHPQEAINGNVMPSNDIFLILNMKTALKLKITLI
jgi:hypothetical protein